MTETKTMIATSKDRWMSVASSIVIVLGVGLCGFGSPFIEPGPPPAVDDCFPVELYNPRFAAIESMALDSTFRSSIRYDEGGDVITRTLREKDTSTDHWHESEGQYSVSFAITAVSYRDGGEVLYVAGIRGPEWLSTRSHPQHGRGPGRSLPDGPIAW